MSANLIIGTVNSEATLMRMRAKYTNEVVIIDHHHPLSPVQRWCDEHCGQCGEVWNASFMRDNKAHYFFANAAHAVAFKLRFG